jgi:hypothetical protein
MRYQSNVSDFAQPAELTHLTPAERRLWASVNRPRRVAIVCAIGLSALSWLALALMASEAGNARTRATS